MTETGEVKILSLGASLLISTWFWVSLEGDEDLLLLIKVTPKASVRTKTAAARKRDFLFFSFFSMVYYMGEFGILQGMEDSLEKVENFHQVRHLGLGIALGLEEQITSMKNWDERRSLLKKGIEGLSAEQYPEHQKKALTYLSAE